MMKTNPLSGLKNLASRLRDNNSGVALIEFAFSLPVLMALGVTGTDTAMFVQKTQMVSQIALTIADNASRIGENSVLQVKEVLETDIVDIMDGAIKQSADPDFLDRSRIFLSSVEYDPADNVPYIHWQRCDGTKDLVDVKSGRTKTFVSHYGKQGDGLNNNSLANGIGPAGRTVKPVPGRALMYVEVQYDYQSLFGLNPFIDRSISSTAAMNVREIRSLTMPIQRNPGETVLDDCL
jgi:hypothetical protein